MNDIHASTTGISESDALVTAPQHGIGARALALAGFTETALADDQTTIISGHTVLPTWLTPED